LPFPLHEDRAQAKSNPWGDACTAIIAQREPHKRLLVEHRVLRGRSVVVVLSTWPLAHDLQIHFSIHWREPARCDWAMRSLGLRIPKKGTQCGYRARGAGIGVGQG
jgi:hypothetical protein